MPYRFFLAAPDKREELEAAGIPISGTLEDLVQQVDVMLDATSAGVGAKNRVLYEKYGKKGVFQGGEKNSVADVFFHGYANYEKGLGAQFLKLTSCNTTGLIRAVDCIDRKVGLEKVAITIIRRVADPGDYHRGLDECLADRPRAEPSGLGSYDHHAACGGDRDFGTHAGDAWAHHHGGGDAEEVGEP